MENSYITGNEGEALEQIIRECNINLEEPEMNLDDSMLEMMEEAGITLVDDNPVKEVQPTKQQMTPKCHICSRALKTHTNLLKHLKTVHKAMTIKCERCGETFNSRKLLAHHKLQKCNN